MWTTHLEVGEEGLFVEGSGLKTEGVDDVVDSLCAVLDALLLILRGRVCAWIGVNQREWWDGGILTDVDVALLD